MPSNGTTFLVSIIVPTSCVLLIILWSVFAYSKFRALVLAHPLAARAVAEQADRPQPDISTPQLRQLIAPAPSSPTFTIHTGLTREGSRIMVRSRKGKARAGQGGTQPARARKVSAWGVGDTLGSLDGERWAGDQDFGHLRQHSAALPSLPPLSPFASGFNTLRRRNGTWHEHDLEVLTSRAPHAPSAVIYTAADPPASFGDRRLVSSSEGHAEGGGAGSQESGYERNGLLAGSRREQTELEEAELERRRWTAVDMAEMPHTASPSFADAGARDTVASAAVRANVPRNSALRRPSSAIAVPPLPPRHPHRQLVTSTQATIVNFIPPSPRLPTSQYSSSSDSQSHHPHRLSTYSQLPHAHPHRSSIASSFTDFYLAEQQHRLEHPPHVEPPIRHHSLGPNSTHRISYPSTSPYALQRARSDPPLQPCRSGHFTEELDNDLTSNTFGRPRSPPQTSRAMSPDALEELEHVAARFEQTKAELLASFGEPCRSQGPYPLRPPMFAHWEGSSGTLPELAPVEEASQLKVSRGREVLELLGADFCRTAAGES